MLQHAKINGQTFLFLKNLLAFGNPFFGIMLFYCKGWKNEYFKKAKSIVFVFYKIERPTILHLKI